MCVCVCVMHTMGSDKECGLVCFHGNLPTPQTALWLIFGPAAASLRPCHSPAGTCTVLSSIAGGSDSLNGGGQRCMCTCVTWTMVNMS